MPDPYVSVILPVYNGASTLVGAVRSILDQTYKDFEVLILNDGSTDNSLSLAGQFTDPRIRVLSDGVNRGLTSRLNQGIELARGKYIARMDSDDLCFPERFEKQVAFLDAHPDVDLLGCRAVVFRDRDHIVGLMSFYGTSHEGVCNAPWNSIRLPHPTWMGRTEWFRKYRYRVPEVLLAEDQELLLRSYPTSRFACLDEVLLAYRRTSFRLYKNLLQRWSLFKMQASYFVSHRQSLNAAKATTVTSVKMLLDILASIPGCEKIFFARMSEEVPAFVHKELDTFKANGLL